ncbi:enoyl-CoA hydratase/isomerase family protein [Nocardia jiangsuensis]|uniref:Enoyl-CoA hydratase/isomerase family protein n=1 Tax=Nocardia jiangsuensis TaxID=1691563 RepID=A0ABV8DM55_9NOCA
MAGPVSAGTEGGYDTVLLDIDAADRVATITLNRPERLNAFDRRMCEELAGIWQALRTDDRVHAVVLRAAGERAFSAGLDIKSSYGQPDSIWHHEDPGELLSPKWQKMWKPVVCAVQGICTAGAFYFVNESDVVLCAEGATFFDSHVSAGLVSALEPIGLMRRVGLGETLRIALLGNDERVGAATALRIGLVSEVVPAEQLWARAHEIAATIAAKPPSATQGTVKAIWESLDKPYRAALDQGLIYTRLGNPLGTAELAARGGPAPTEPRIR